MINTRYIILPYIHKALRAGLTEKTIITILSEGEPQNLKGYWALSKLELKYGVKPKLYFIPNKEKRTEGILFPYDKYGISSFYPQETRQNKPPRRHHYL